MDRRTEARELAMQVLYQLDVQGDELLGRVDGFLRENTEDGLVLELAGKWAMATWEHLSDCDELISSAMIKWDLSRLGRVDRSILRLAVFQLKYCDDMPVKVVINEAIEIAKKYGGEQSPRFVNGVLDAVKRNIDNPADDADV